VSAPPAADSPDAAQDVRPEVVAAVRERLRVLADVEDDPSVKKHRGRRFFRRRSTAGRGAGLSRASRQPLARRLPVEPR